MKNPLVPSFFLVFLLFYSCIIMNPTPEDCEVVEATITGIYEGSTYDIVFRTDKGERYYINRGLELGLNLEELNKTVLNKSVTLHLAKILGGSVTSEHISQIAVGEQIVFTEFK